MSQSFVKTKPSLMEAGLPCSSLSAECQRDNNARQRPPQNRLHIWWARRPPTVCRVAILSALLPHDVKLDESHLPEWISEPTRDDIADLPAKLEKHRALFEQILDEIGPTALPEQHLRLLRALGITGDGFAAYRRLARRDELCAGGPKVSLPDAMVYRHPAPFGHSPSEGLLRDLLANTRQNLQLGNEPFTVLDFMAGGGSIPLEAVRYGAKVYANDLNPVASLVLKATLEYPARFGSRLAPYLERAARAINEVVRERIGKFFSTELASDWWPQVRDEARSRFQSKQITNIEAGGDALTRDYLWCRVIACPKCGLNIPLSTNFHIVTKKGKPEAAVAAFPEVPASGNDCTFRIVGADQWKDCRWPRLGSEPWHPRNTPTFQDGHALCPRCDADIVPDEVKKAAQSRPGGLPCVMYAVCSQVPVKLTYSDGATKVRYLWRFRAPTDADRAAVAAAETELRANEGRWANLIPTEAVEEGDKTREPRLVGIKFWKDFFQPRQLLTVVTVLDEVRKASAKARAELPPAEAEAVAVYLAFIVSKVVNYNSVNTFWHYGRQTVTQTFSRHDFAFRTAFCEFEGARETVMWGASQVIGAYTQLAGLIHGEAVSLEADDEDGAVEDEVEEAEGTDADTTSSTDAPAPAALRPEVLVPTVTNNDAAALETPAAGTVHLICVDPPYYNNVQYSELSNFFYVWLKRALGDWPGLEPFFVHELAETNAEAVANAVRWKAEAEKEAGAWQARFEAEFARLEGAKGENGRKLTKPDRTARAKEAAGPNPLTAGERAEQFYESKMAAVFRRARHLLHPAGRMVVMFNHKMTKAWRALGRALIEAGFEIRTSIPIHTEAESSLNIRGLDAARSTVLLLCVPRAQTGQVTGNWGRVQDQVVKVAQNAARHFQKQGIGGTDLYLSALGPALGEVGRHWPITDIAGRPVDVTVALERAYAAVGQFRLNQILTEKPPRGISGIIEGYAADAADKNTQALWLWLDTFEGEVADSDDVRKLAKSLDIEPETFKKLKLIESESDLFTLRAPQDVDLAQLARQQSGDKAARGRAAREEDVWEERTFPNFVGAAVWNAVAMLAGGDEARRGIEPLKRWLRASGYGDQRDFRGAFAVTLFLLERAFGRRKDDDPWKAATAAARRGWDVVLRDWRG